MIILAASLAVALTLIGEPVSEHERAARLADIAALRDQVVNIDASYSPEERATASLMITELQADATALSAAAFQLRLAEIAALSDNGHTRTLSTQWPQMFGQMPVRFLIADDGLIIADAAGEYERLIGTPVDGICGFNLEDLRSVWGNYATGTQGYQDEYLVHFIETPAMLRAGGVCGETVDLLLANGEAIAVTAQDNAFPAPEGVWAFLPQARLIDLAAAGRIAGDPLYLQDPEAVFRLVALPQHEAVYIQFRANVDFSREVDIHELANAAITRIEALAPRFIIVDQRFNVGGDLNTTRDLMQAIPALLPEDGRVFAISSGRTFSAGISSLGYLKQAAGERFIQVGAPVGDALEFWAEGDVVELPGSGTMVMMATERHNYMTGCPEDDCHGSIQIHPIAIDGLNPDVQPAANGADLLSGRDPYLDTVFELIAAAE